MAQIIQKISVDVSKPNFFQAIVAKQFDSGTRFVKATFIHNNEKVHIEPTATVTINATRSDGSKDSFAGEVNDDGTATLPLTYWMLELVGTVKCDISVLSGDSRLTSTSFDLEVEKASNNSGDVSEDESYDVLLSLIERVEAIENIESTTNKVTEINEKSTHDQYPSAKAVYDLFDNLELGDVVTPENVGTTVQDGSITRQKVADELLEEIGLDLNHHLTEVPLETFRCNWDGTENATGSYTMIKPFKTPTYIKLSKAMPVDKNVQKVFSSVEDFSTDTKTPPDFLFFRYYKENELEPMYMENVPGYEYCRMLFRTSVPFTATAYYDSYKVPISTEDTKAKLGLWKGLDNRTYVAAVVPYKDCKFYLADSSQVNNGQSRTDIYGTSNDNIFSDIIQQSLYGATSISPTADTDYSTYVHLYKVGQYAEKKEGENYLTFDASTIVGHHPKYLVFPLTRNNISATTRDEALAEFRANSLVSIFGGLSDTLPIKENKFIYKTIENPLKGSHWLLLGDSITDWFAGRDYSGEGFASKIALEFDMTFSNIAYEGENLNGGISRLNEYINGVELGTNLIPDYVTIAYGTNGNNATIGTVDDSEDTATYPGWTKKIITLIREKFPNAMIGFVLPMQGDWVTWNGSTLKDIKGNHDAIKGVLELPEYAVPYIDMYYESGIIPSMLHNDEYPNDTIHPRSEKAQNKYYHAMRRFMMGL